MVVERPSDKVLVAAVLAFVGALAVQVVDSSVPADWWGWVQLVARAVVLSGVVGGASYAKVETNPPRSWG